MNGLATTWPLRGAMPEYVGPFDSYAFAPTNQIRASNADSWDSIISKISKLKWLGCDWDGEGAIAPSEELVESAILLAKYLRSKRMLPPSRIMPGIDGAVAMEWQRVGEIEHLDIVRPYYLERYSSAPGRTPSYDEFDFRSLVSLEPAPSVYYMTIGDARNTRFATYGQPTCPITTRPAPWSLLGLSIGEY